MKKIVFISCASKKIDKEKQKQIENQATFYLQKNFSFAVMEINDREERLKLESKLISSLSACKECRPSNEWLGLCSPKEKIRQSGLWLVNELYKEPFADEELNNLLNQMY